MHKCENVMKNIYKVFFLIVMAVLLSIVFKTYASASPSTEVLIKKVVMKKQGYIVATENSRCSGCEIFITNTKYSKSQYSDRCSYSTTVKKLSKSNSHTYKWLVPKGSYYVYACDARGKRHVKVSTEKIQTARNNKRSAYKTAACYSIKPKNTGYVAVTVSNDAVITQHNKNLKKLTSSQASDGTRTVYFAVKKKTQYYFSVENIGKKNGKVRFQTHAFSNNGGSKKSTAVSVGKTPVKSLIFPGTRNTKWFKHTITAEDEDQNFVNLHVEAGLSGRMFFYLYYKDSSESGYLSSGTTDRQLYLSNHRLEEGDVIYINIGNMKGESGYFTIQCTYEA